MERVAWIAEVGVRSWGCDAATVALAADKHRLCQRLADAGVPVPRGISLEPGELPPRDFAFPAVLKPRDGAGSQDTLRIDHWSVDLPCPRGPARLEEFCPGFPASVALLCGPKARVALPACGQLLSDDGRFHYRGGYLPLAPPLSARAERLARRAMEVLPEARGYVGVDLVLGADAAQDRVIEINPRLTTSYVGLRAAFSANLLAVWQRVLAGEEVSLCALRRGTIRRTRRRCGKGGPGDEAIMKWLAFDIGGANLKAADGEGFASTQHFALWREPHQLSDSLRAMIAQVPKVDHLAATMTGELADCFATKSEGVEFIVRSFSAAADSRHTRIYLNNGTLVTPQIALRQPLLAAAANWHALARFAGRFASQGPALLIDIGSTTCDIIPLVDGVPQASGKSDPERLTSGELLYTGVERSPICALLAEFEWRGQRCQLAQELFATTWDAYLMLGELPDEPFSTHTADRRPATRGAARDRLARMICCDRTMFDEDDARRMSALVAVAQLGRLTTAVGQVIARMAGPPATIVLSGRGEFLARRAVQAMQLTAPVVSLNAQLGPAVSRSATAHALAVLGREGKS